jgi:hypothetical protein
MVCSKQVFWEGGMTELWKQAYEKEFGHSPNDDQAENAADVEEWRIKWQSGYDAGEDWAKAMVDEGEQ